MLSLGMEQLLSNGHKKNKKAKAKKLLLNHLQLYEYLSSLNSLKMNTRLI